ncbi:MAG: AtpZ/AtpI family protein [Deltaproteobacteria bacterium]|nr:AtpZ/AtpI family protein [Deltaproteobacteria bacterium]
MDKESKQAAIQMAYASSIGIAMVLAIFGCLFLGAWLDRKLGTEPYFTLLLLLVGIVAGFRNLYVLIKKYFMDDKPIITCVKSEPHRKRPPPKKA